MALQYKLLLKGGARWGFLKHSDHSPFYSLLTGFTSSQHSFVFSDLLPPHCTSLFLIYISIKIIAKAIQPFASFHLQFVILTPSFLPPLQTHTPHCFKTCWTLKNNSKHGGKISIRKENTSELWLWCIAMNVQGGQSCEIPSIYYWWMQCIWIIHVINVNVPKNK